MAKKTTAIAIKDAPNLSEFRAAKHDAAGLKELLGGIGLSVADLPQVRMPSGGSTTWEIPTIGDQVRPEKEIRGVVIYSHDRRVYWPNPEPEEGVQPDCISNDGVTGYGDPGGDCVSCPLSQFGSGKGNSQACTLRHTLYILPAGTILPLRLSVSPASLGQYRTYRVGLLNELEKAPRHVLSAFTTVKKTSGGGQPYSQLEINMIAELVPAEIDFIQAYSEQIVPAIEAEMNRQPRPRTEWEEQSGGADDLQEIK